jgi:hypothetical protein
MGKALLASEKFNPNEYFRVNYSPAPAIMIEKI